jgi:cytoskeletal protein RodZ
MNTFGDKLKRQREDHDTTIEELAGTTGIGQIYLEALEHGQFEDLPGRAFGKLYIRAYAEVLGFDPRPWLAEYDRARRDREQVIPPDQWHTKPILVPPTVAAARAAAEPQVQPAQLDELADAVIDEPQLEPSPSPAEDESDESDEPESVSAIRQAPESEIIETGPAAEAHGGAIATSAIPKSALIAIAATVGVVATVWILFAMFGTEKTDVAPDSIVTASQTAIPAESESAIATAAPPAAQQADATAAAVDTPRLESGAVEPNTASPGRLSIGEYGVGRDRRLRNRNERFEEGEVAWFSTQVIGGRSGDRIRHVWLRDGKNMQSIDLDVGSSRWRTQSYKTLWGAGSWTVEARDSEGRVLATAAFTCTPKTP